MIVLDSNETQVEFQDQDCCIDVFDWIVDVTEVNLSCTHLFLFESLDIVVYIYF